MLEVKNLTFQVNENGIERSIVENISFNVEDGEMLVITGPNGGGKSTLAKVLMGIDQASAGQIILDRTDISDYDINHRAEAGIGYAFQQPPRFKGMTVSKLLSLAAGEDLTRDVCCRLLSTVGLCANEYIEREVDGTLSGGEMKRLEIATVLAKPHKLCIFDEPEAGIDLWSFSMLIEQFEKMHKEKKQSLILISHQERIIQMADRIMKDGLDRTDCGYPSTIIRKDSRFLQLSEMQITGEEHTMTLLDKITEKVLAQIDDTGFTQSGAFNLRHNGIALCHGDSEHIKIKKKQDKPGIDIFIDGKTDGEEVHIPVVVDASGMTDVVYNDFYVAEGANVTIVAGCGIHNSGCNESRHDGIHTFHVEKNANVRYVEKHYGEGEGTGARVLNPVTEVYLGENSVFTLDTAQIKGVDSTVRENNVHLEAGSKLYVIEKLMTHGKQEATSNMMVELLGEGSSAQIVSRSVAKGESRQVFHPRAVGKNRCHAHVQCDSIIMDHAEVSSIPEINAKHVDAAIIHEAAIGRINDEQLIKLRTLGMTEEEAEGVIIENFLN